MSDILDRLEHSIAQARAMDRARLLEDAAYEIRRLRSLADNRCQRPPMPARSPEMTLGDDPYSRDPNPS